MHNDTSNLPEGVLRDQAPSVVVTPGAHQFVETFARCYNECRGLYSDDEFTEHVWRLWPEFFFKCKRSPLLKSESVISRVASALHLEYWDGEPLRLDMVLYPKGEGVEWGFPFPILVALEHEEGPRGFGNEIMKLLSVRCPLKVGITHTVTKDMNKEREAVHQQIVDKFRRIRAINQEDPRSEYVFLIGSQERPKDPKWYGLSFRAGDGPGDQKFERVKGM